MHSLSALPCHPKTRSDLEWDRVLEAIEARCVSFAGRQLACNLPFSTTIDQTRQLLAEASEASALLTSGEPLPVGELADTSEAMGRVAAAAVLAPAEIREVGKALGMARGLRRFLNARKSRVPALVATCTTDSSLDALADELTQAFDVDGLLADHASPRLKQLRTEYRAARARMLSRLEEIMSKYEAVVQERYVTEREGRYVIPVRSDSHERFAGIVHASSASGATLFVEPRAVIAMGNRLKVLEADVQREEIAVYAFLSQRIGDYLPSVRAAIDALARADVRAATARLADELRLSFVAVTNDARMNLLRARHPLLLLDALTSNASDSSQATRTGLVGRQPRSERDIERAFERVIPSDLHIAQGHAIVVSGPNAGGKTVALKTMGLIALMIRAGLPVPCDPSSEVGIFGSVLTDVGDDQNITKNLSTFSAHVRNLSAIVDNTEPGALVLLDELAGGTDPREGEALAAAMLDALTARGGAVVVTTHYEGLKALALADNRFANASMGFNLGELSPTFKLIHGVPGSSSALAVARKFGLPPSILERAERFLSRENVQFERVVQQLHDERNALELARAAAEHREQQAMQMQSQLQQEIQAVRQREQRQLSQEAQSLKSALIRAREELREAQSRLRAKTIEGSDAKNVERILDRVAATMAIGGELAPLVAPRADQSAAPADETLWTPVDRSALKKGLRVWVPRLNAECSVLECLADGSVRVQAGAMRLLLAASDLRLAKSPADPSEPRKPSPRAQPAAASPAGLAVALQTSDNTCDLRGLRTDDAIAMAVTFLDRSINEDRRVCFFVHGHGTGALKDAIRKELSRSPYIRFFRPASPEEGGDGATVAWLA